MNPTHILTIQPTKLAIVLTPLKPLTFTLVLQRPLPLHSSAHQTRYIMDLNPSYRGNTQSLFIDIACNYMIQEIRQNLQDNIFKINFRDENESIEKIDIDSFDVDKGEYIYGSSKEPLTLEKLFVITPDKHDVPKPKHKRKVTYPHIGSVTPRQKSNLIRL